MSDAATIVKLLEEGAIPVHDLVALLPPETGKRRRPETLVRWIVHGKKGIRLEGFCGGGKGWYSSKQALARFFAALTEKRVGTQPACPPPAPSGSQRARSEAAGR